MQEVDALMQSRAAENGLTYKTRIAANTPNSLKGDFGRINQVLFNLVGNAIKFTKAGGVTVDVSHSTLGGGRCLLRFGVTDTGIGIETEKQEFVFEKFTQADASTTRVFGGTGLGLAICRDLVAMMGGEIGVISEPGKGSEFWFTVDCEESAASSVGVSPRATTSALQTHPWASQPLHILLAEDNEINQKIAVATLEDAGHRVDVVGNGAEAVNAVAGNSYDVVLMDVHMPVMDGVAATTEIRRLPGPASKTPLIALTANAMVGDRDKYIAHGMDGYASKPFDPEVLLATIRNCIANDAAEKPRPAPATCLDPAIVAPLRTGKPDFWQRLVGIYLETTPASLEMLEQAIAGADCTAVALATHALKSPSANMGAKSLAALCQRLETAAKAGNLEDGPALLGDIRREFAAVSAELTADLETGSTAQGTTA